MPIATPAGMDSGDIDEITSRGSPALPVPSRKCTNCAEFPLDREPAVDAPRYAYQVVLRPLLSASSPAKRKNAFSRATTIHRRLEPAQTSSRKGGQSSGVVKTNPCSGSYGSQSSPARHFAQVGRFEVVPSKSAAIGNDDPCWPRLTSSISSLIVRVRASAGRWMSPPRWEPNRFSAAVISESLATANNALKPRLMNHSFRRSSSSSCPASTGTPAADRSIIDARGNWRRR
ncbi:hypothetical protein IQ16_07313 [Bradyrhizobium huanghuaihaiense]|uniref:Uncharacterized protein n=1 Tax=Bradyrhizobium huanghuaihaiense TaxID=990078 RepID=A0A562QVU0_9BRAD|nr:hypothetical protein IQ16_07313 [Bradyrhizobium huanghuaihaiense]